MIDKAILLNPTYLVVSQTEYLPREIGETRVVRLSLTRSCSVSYFRRGRMAFGVGLLVQSKNV